VSLLRGRTGRTEGLLAHGFHTELGMTADDDYRASLPQLSEQPGAYIGRFDLPLVVETRIDWPRQADLVGITTSGFSPDNLPRPVSERSRVPTQPYAGWWSRWGQRFPDPIAPADARAQLREDEVGGNPHEAIAMHLAYPGLNRAFKFWDLIGYVRPNRVTLLDNLTGFDRTMCLLRRRRSAKIGANLHPEAFSVSRPLVRGSTIVTL
jgi:hypothetical protein